MPHPLAQRLHAPAWRAPRATRPRMPLALLWCMGRTHPLRYGVAMVPTRHLRQPTAHRASLAAAPWHLCTPTCPRCAMQPRYVAPLLHTTPRTR